jgi:hypothetical protein
LNRSGKTFRELPNIRFPGFKDAEEENYENTPGGIIFSPFGKQESFQDVFVFVRTGT